MTSSLPTGHASDRDVTGGGHPPRLMEPRVLRCHLPEEVRPGLYWPDGDPPYILVHDELHPHEERSVVAHELAHHRRGGGISRSFMPHGWRREVAREERKTDRAAARELVPPADLSAWIDGHDWDLHVGIGPRDVADEYGVTERIARAALENLNEWERTRGRG